MTHTAIVLVVAVGILLFVETLALAVVGVVLALEVRRLGVHVAVAENSADEWRQSFYAQRDLIHRQRAEVAADPWWNEIESYANGTGEAA